MSLPTTHKAILVSSLREPLDIQLQEVPTPSPTPGSAILKVLSVYVPPSGEGTFTGKYPIPMQLPLTPGYGAVCRVAAVGPDAVLIRPGQLVLAEVNVRARDQPSVNILQSGFFAVTPAEKHLAKEWNKGSYADYVKAPLENIFPLDEDNLINKMGYSINDLCYLPLLIVPMGGLVDVDVKPGQSVIVAPATGAFGGATVIAALASGTRVVAAGRNEDTLKAMVQVLGPLYGDRLISVKLTGDVEVDTEALKRASPGGQGYDAYIDFSPPQAAMTTHITSCLGAMKTFGKVCLMGYIHGNIQIPYAPVVLKSLEIRGRYMYDRKAVVQLINMVEAGIVKVGKGGGIEVIGAYKLEEFEAALSASAANPGFGKQVVISP